MILLPPGNPSERYAAVQRFVCLLSHRQRGGREGCDGGGGGYKDGKIEGSKWMHVAFSPKGTQAPSVRSPGLCNRICKQHLWPRSPLSLVLFLPLCDVHVAKGNRNSGLKLAASKPFKRQGGVLPQQIALPVF